MYAASTFGSLGSLPAISARSARPSRLGPTFPRGQFTPGTLWQLPQPTRSIAIFPCDGSAIGMNCRCSGGESQAASANATIGNKRAERSVADLCAMSFPLLPWLWSLPAPKWKRVRWIASRATAELLLSVGPELAPAMLASPVMAWTGAAMVPALLASPVSIPAIWSGNSKPMPMGVATTRRWAGLRRRLMRANEGPWPSITRSCPSGLLEVPRRDLLCTMRATHRAVCSPAPPATAKVGKALVQQIRVLPDSRPLISPNSCGSGALPIGATTQAA